MSARVKRRGHWGQVVALADILANGVAILMMLIVLSIKIQSDQAQEEVNQNADITTILSRDMAKSIIFNDLPSSPPAVLHDYNSCVVLHDCNESLYPILEVHDDYVRMKNENVRVSLMEMLRRPNPIDHWLSAFSTIEKQNIRMDIYGVGAYYLALSILSENGIHHPRHWHFLTQPAGHKREGMTSEDFIAKYEDSRSLDDKNGGLDGEDSADGASGTQGDERNEDESLPFSPESLNDLTMIEGSSFSDLTERGMLSGGGSSESDNQQGGQSELEVKSRLSEGDFKSVGISMPNMPKSFMEMQSGDSPAQLTSREFMLFTALFLLHYGEELKGFQVPYLQKTLSDLFKRPRHIRRNSNFFYIAEVSAQLDEVLAEADVWPEYFVNQEVGEVDRVGLSGRSVSFINEFTYQTMSDASSLTERLSLMLRPWPSAYQGERSEITDSIVMVHPLHLQQDIEGLRWIPMAFLTPVEETLNINLGFVLAEINDGQIFIPAEFNQIWTKSGPLRPVRTDVEVQPTVMRLFYIYFPLSVIFLFGFGYLFVRAWRHKSIDASA